MTKYEWESELKKNIHRLPADEISRVMEYYDELFADKIERGYNEYEIIGQFGNPVDVADKILSEYDGELKDTTPTPTPDLHDNAEQKSVEEIAREIEQKAQAAADEKAEEKAEEKPATPVAADEKSFAQKPQKKCGTVRGERLAIIAIIAVLTGFAPIWVIGSIWITAVALLVSGFACAVGGIAGAFISILTVFSGSVGTGVAQIGICLGVCGVGILLAVACFHGIRLLGKATQWLCHIVWQWVCPVEKTEVKA